MAVLVGIEITSTGTIKSRIRDSSSNSVDQTSTSTINDGNWHHVTATRDTVSDTVAFYVDGKKEAGADKDGGKIDAIPGSEIELKITVENLYGRNEDADIKDILIDLEYKNQFV